MFISLELVPRERESFVAEVRWVREHVPEVTHVNIPDLVRLSTRSWEASAWVEKAYPVIVHVRACDVRAKDVESFYRMLVSYGVSDVLVVQGDREGEDDGGMTSVELIRELSRQDPSLRIYAALDPYRQSLSAEMAYAEEKLRAGARGFLTQPFFERTLFETYLASCRGLEVWWGVSPILSEKSLCYWRDRNRVPLADDYDLSLEGNARWARFVLEHLMGEKQAALYLMPIRVEVSRYLPAIFEKLS